MHLSQIHCQTDKQYYIYYTVLGMERHIAQSPVNSVKFTMGINAEIIISFREFTRSREEPQRWSKAWEALLFGNRLRELGLSKLETRRLKGHLLTMFQYLQSGYKKNGDSLYTGNHTEKMKDNRYNVNSGEIQTGHKRKVLYNEISQWNNLLKKVVNFPVLDIFEIQID